MNRTESFRQIGRIIKAACPPGTGFAAVIDNNYMASADRQDVGRLLAEWLKRRPRVALAASAVYTGPAAGESTAAFLCRQRLELQCAAIAGAVSHVFAAAKEPVTLAFFLFEFGGPGSLMAYKIIGSEPLAIAWITAIAALGKSSN